jgi:hypothetical protein
MRKQDAIVGLRVSVFRVAGCDGASPNSLEGWKESAKRCKSTSTVMAAPG